MNVPLKKRHNYGKINGSASSLNEPSVKRLHSSYSNYDSEYEHQSSNMDESIQNRPATLGHIPKGDNKIPHQYLSVMDKAGPSNVNATGGASTVVSSSSSVIMSSASNRDSHEQNDDDISSSSGSDSDTTGTSKSSEHSEALSACDPLTEDALAQHNADFEPMNSKERIQFWNIADEFSDIEDDFDDKKYFSKPIRSERVQKRMYTQPAPVFCTSRKTKKDQKEQKEQKELKDNKETKEQKTKTKKTDDKQLSSTKKTKNDEVVKTKSLPSKSPMKSKMSSMKSKLSPVNSTPIQSNNVERKSTFITETPSPQPKPPHPPPAQQQQPPAQLNNNVILSRPSNEVQSSSIMFRVNYNKDKPNRSEIVKSLNTMPNQSSRQDVGCVNCACNHIGGKLNESTDLPENNQEEFYKYLRIDTNPIPQEKVSPAETSPNDANYRRSLRVFIQQKQYEHTKSTKDEQIQQQQKSTSPNTTMSTENGKLLSRSLNGIKSNMISSHIKQRRSYEPNGFDIKENGNKSSSDTINETEEQQAQQNGECSSNRAANKLVNKPKRKILLPSPIMLTEMFKRYKQCFRQGFAMRQHMRQQTIKRIKKRPTNKVETNVLPNLLGENSAPIVDVNSDNVKHIDDACEELINTFSPTSITHSNASTDSAIVINSNVNDLCQQPQITIKSNDSLQWQRDRTNNIDKSQFSNILDPKNGTVHAILTHSISPNNDDIIVVVQESQISYWHSTAKVLSMFGIAKNWTKIIDIRRITQDIEVNSLYQHRLIDIGEQFPVYVELRARESPPDEFRQSYLTFAYLNVYHVKTNIDEKLEILMERVDVDTLKGFANSIYYTALPKSPSILMKWTEQNVNNQTRCGIVKYTLKTPTLDNFEDIFDYAFLQHDIKTLYAFNDYHVVGCGDRTVSMWDHRNGNLLIDIEIEVPTLGQNIACYTVGDDVPDYMLLIQLISAEATNDECGEQLKVMAVQTGHPYNWRTLQTHNIPSSYGKIRSIFNKDDLLTITFSSGTLMFLNISSPHKIYVRNVMWPNGIRSVGQVNGLSNKVSQLFTQSNGQIIEISSEWIGTKSVWEYFIDKNSN